MSTKIPANLFKWYADPKLGFWSPMLDKLPKALIDNIVKHNAKSIVIERDVIKGITIPKDFVMPWPKRVSTPDEAWVGSLALAANSDITASGILAGTVAVSAVPFTAIGDAVDEVWRVPIVAALAEAGFDVHTSEYRTGVRPLNQRYWNKQYTPLLPEAYRIGLAASKGLLEDGKYYLAMAESGFNEEWADVWREENYFYPEFGLTLELYWRNVISKDVAVTWLVRAGYKKAVAEQMLVVAEQIPPAPDIITMVVREAFMPEMVIAAPDLFTKYMIMRGFSKEWADRYWTAHFLPIALTQAYSNLWRGYWDKTKFFKALTIADIHPMWHDDIYNVAFNPPSLRELGYGWDVGVYSESDIERYRRMEGLSEVDAKLAARSMVAYRTEAERESVRREHMYLFAVGKETEEELRANLVRLITAKEAIELWVERAKLYKDRSTKPELQADYLIVTSSEAIASFKLGLRDELWLRQKLKELDWTDERIQVAVERAKKEIEPVPVVEKPPEVRKLALSQIQDLYNIGELPAELIPQAIADIGYSQDIAIKLAAVITYEAPAKVKVRALTETDVEDLYSLDIYTREDLEKWYLAVGYSPNDALVKVELSVVNTWIPQLKTLYGNGWINAEELYSELNALKLPEDATDRIYMSIVKYQQPARLATEKDLTKTEILKGAKIKLFTPEQTRGLLVDIGYSEEEATYLMVLNNIIAAGDPESYWDMREATEAYKAALGKKPKEIPQQLKELEKKVKEARDKLQALRTSGASDDAVAQAALELQTAELAYRKALVLWEQAS